MIVKIEHLGKDQIRYRQIPKKKKIKFLIKDMF